MDLAVESEYDIRRQGTLMVAKYAMGHGVLRPESAVELRKLNPDRGGDLFLPLFFILWQHKSHQPQSYRL